MGNSSNRNRKSGSAQDPSGDPTDSEEPPGPASQQAQHLHWSPGPTTPGMRMRQTPVNNIHDAANTQQEWGGNAQEHPRSSPKVLGRVPQPASTTSTHVLGQMETAPATWPACKNELADTLTTTNCEALLPRTGIYDTTPMTIGEASLRHQSTKATFSQTPTVKLDHFAAILEQQAQVDQEWIAEWAAEREAALQQWKADFQPEADRQEAQQQAETHKLFEEIAREVAQYQEETHKALESLRDDIVRLMSSMNTAQQDQVVNNPKEVTASEYMHSQTSHKATRHMAANCVQAQPTHTTAKTSAQQKTHYVMSHNAQMNPTHNHDPQRHMSKGEDGRYHPPP